MIIVEVVVMLLGVALAAWGLFHQLIVGAAVTLYRDLDDTAARIMVMSWVSQGAFMSFCGILSTLLVFFYGLRSDAVQTALILCSAGMLFLSGHVVVSGYRAHLKPIRIGAVISGTYGLVLLAVVLVGSIFLV